MQRAHFITVTQRPNLKPQRPPARPLSRPAKHSSLSPYLSLTLSLSLFSSALAGWLYTYMIPGRCCGLPLVYGHGATQPSAGQVSKNTHTTATAVHRPPSTALPLVFANIPPPPSPPHRRRMAAPSASPGPFRVCATLRPCWRPIEST